MKPADLQLQNCWDAFATVAIPEGAAPEQHEAMYLAFLSGAATVLQLHQALQEHAPTNLATGIERWRAHVTAELARVGAGTHG